MEIRPLKLPESIPLEEESSFFHEVSAGRILDGSKKSQVRKKVIPETAGSVSESACHENRNVLSIAENVILGSGI